MDFLIVSGLSGAGKSQAAAILEDAGFYCVDNMPPEFITQFAQFSLATRGRYEQVAIVTDIRAGQNFEGLFKAMGELSRICDYKIVFMEASNDVIIHRYKETRHKHPINLEGSLEAAVERERELMAPLRARADYIIDTTAMSTSKLRGELLELFGAGPKERSMVVNIISFGFKYGLPIEADLVFDVRFLPNPHYIDELRPKNGLDPEIVEFVTSYNLTKDFVAHLQSMFSFLLPCYMEEGKSSLVIAVGCTGGKHRSVVISKALGDFITQKGYNVVVSHRDMSRS